MSSFLHNRHFHPHINEGTKEALIVIAFFTVVVTLTYLFFY
jgi:hypothetical protein